MKIAAVLVGLIAVSGFTPAQRAGSEPTELAWVGLFTTSLVEWLENENRMQELCTPSQGSVDRCREEKMAPKVLTIPVRAAARRSAPIAGTVVVVATPGRSLRAYASTGGIAREFQLDLFDGDWGYGPYFHQTIRARSGTWFQVPIPGISDRAWIDASEWTETPDVVPVDGIVDTPLGSMMVLGVVPGALRVRPEQDADMPCDALTPPPVVPFKEIRIPFKDLFDAHGHLRVHVKYTRGC